MGPWPGVLEEYLRRGGTLVVNAEAARRKLPDRLLGFALTGTFETVQGWVPEGGAQQPSTPYQVERGQVQGAQVLAWAAPGVPLIVRHPVGAGAVILTLVPRMLGLDERAHPALPSLLNGLTAGLLPVEVRRPDGGRLTGEVLYQVNQTRDGYLVLLVNNRGVDKTPNGIARVDRRAFVDVVVRSALPVASAKEYTEPRELPLVHGGDQTEARLRVPPGDVQVVYLTVR